MPRKFISLMDDGEESGSPAKKMQSGYKEGKQSSMESKRNKRESVIFTLD